MKATWAIPKRAIPLISAVGLLLATLAPGLLTATVSAGTVTSRSIQMSSATTSATAVVYTLNFTPVTTGAGAVILDFCSNSPIYGNSCTAPTGFSATGVTTTTGSTTVSTLAANTIKIVPTSSYTTSAVSVNLTGITNPSTAGQFYARIVTFDTSAHAGSYTATGANTGKSDDGGVALSAVQNIAVTASVQESLAFCVSGSDTSVAGQANCGGTMTAPQLKLGTAIGTTNVIDSSAVYTGTAYTQISTNAASGATVYMKSDATSCGGMLRTGAPGACNIGPATADITAGQALFGVKTGLATATSTSGAAAPSGTYQATNSYSNTSYLMNYTAGNSAGVTGPYGDAILNTATGPVNNKNMPLIFGVSASPSTPAGNYYANISLIATATF